MTEAELVEELTERIGDLCGDDGDMGSAEIAGEILRWMKHAAETAEVKVDLSTSGKVYKTYLRPGLPE